MKLNDNILKLNAMNIGAPILNPRYKRRYNKNGNSKSCLGSLQTSNSILPDINKSPTMQAMNEELNQKMKMFNFEVDKKRNAKKLNIRK